MHFLCRSVGAQRLRQGSFKDAAAITAAHHREDVGQYEDAEKPLIVTCRLTDQLITPFILFAEKHMTDPLTWRR